MSNSLYSPCLVRSLATLQHGYYLLSTFEMFSPRTCNKTPSSACDSSCNTLPLRYYTHTHSYTCTHTHTHTRTYTHTYNVHIHTYMHTHTHTPTHTHTHTHTYTHTHTHIHTHTHTHTHIHIHTHTHTHIHTHTHSHTHTHTHTHTHSYNHLDPHSDFQEVPIWRATSQATRHDHPGGPLRQTGSTEEEKAECLTSFSHRPHPAGVPSTADGRSKG